MSEKSISQPAGWPERPKLVRYFKLKDVLDRDGIAKLAKYLDPDSLREALETPLEQPEVRESYAARMLELLGAGLDEDDKEKIAASLVGIGAGVSSLTATEERSRESFFGCQAAKQGDKYVVALGSGTGGQRILLMTRRDGGYERLLFFPSQGEVRSGDYQRAFQLLFGSRVINTSRVENEPDLVMAINEEAGEDICPCGSWKKFKECHGAKA